MKEVKKNWKFNINQFKGEKIRTYYNGDYFGRSTSCLMFYLAQQLNKDSNEFIWWSILGLTDLLIHSKITNNQYQDMVQDLYNYILKINSLEHGFNILMI